MSVLVRPFRFLFGSLRRLSHNPRFHNLAFPYMPTFHVGSAACLIICVLPRGACLAVAGDSAGGCSFWLATVDEAQVTTTAAAMLSLALGIGSCVAAFRLVDALFSQSLCAQNTIRGFLESRVIGKFKPRKTQFLKTPFRENGRVIHRFPTFTMTACSASES